MRTYQKSIDDLLSFDTAELDFTPQFFLLFVGSKVPFISEFVDQLKSSFKDSLIIGCSTSGEILDDTVKDQSISLTAVKFEKTEVRLTEIAIDEMSKSRDTGIKLTEQIEKEGLRHLFVLSDGLNINGAELVKGITENLPEGVTVTGGLAGDGADFEKTFVINGEIKDKKIAALALYGEDLKIGYGSKGGWDSFGIERSVTKAEGSVLYELDGSPALDVYKRYLGEKANDLPGSGLLFPLSLRIDENKPVVRTLLGVNEEDKSITFAGNIPEGSYVRLMKANIDRLIDGAADSAEISNQISGGQSQLAILISCVGRKLVLKQLVEEEIEAVKESLDSQTSITGFYSYGEIAPFGEFSPCKLHNQTMTITTFAE